MGIRFAIKGFKSSRLTNWRTGRNLGIKRFERLGQGKAELTVPAKHPSGRKPFRYS